MAKKIENYSAQNNMDLFESISCTIDDTTLQALAIIIIPLHARSSRNTRRRALPPNASTLSPLRYRAGGCCCRGRRCRSRRCGSRRGSGGGRGSSRSRSASMSRSVWVLTPLCSIRDSTHPVPQALKIASYTCAFLFKLSSHGKAAP